MINHYVGKTILGELLLKFGYLGDSFRGSMGIYLNIERRERLNVKILINT